MEVYDVGINIIKCNKKIEEVIDEIENFVSSKKFSTSKMLYRKAMEKSARVLKADGNPIGVIKMLAEGECSAEEQKFTDAEIEWKALLARKDGWESILNGWQSYNRHLGTVTNG